MFRTIPCPSGRHGEAGQSRTLDSPGPCALDVVGTHVVVVGLDSGAAEHSRSGDRLLAAPGRVQDGESGGRQAKARACDASLWCLVSLTWAPSLRRPGISSQPYGQTLAGI
jgi:hypothetical protein